MGAAKATLPPLKTLFMGVVASLHISMGGLLALTVGGACPGEPRQARARGSNCRRVRQILPVPLCCRPQALLPPTPDCTGL
jgi:hypothetical protein